jgi:hypothetical protein
LRDRQAERLGGLEVDNQLEGGRLLDGRIGGFDALQKLDELSGEHVSVELDDARAIAGKPALLSGFRPLIYRGKPNAAARSKMNRRRTNSSGDANTLNPWAPAACDASMAPMMSSGLAILPTASLVAGYGAEQPVRLPWGSIQVRRVRVPTGYMPPLSCTFSGG